ncbi:MAG: 16S rRNA (cytidine(1402)-2'-O)-methyltransferase [Bryobacterales bacterium]|nr:16S rRNA (cytidine(1402)-2'-O)-methyltransferase [Bryobacteraceae bacterium]MDW8353335.1 16S rRNA (cytidine(1402)-2'-O)-methyltransferase [Bryobacterales bacterium]
MAGVLYLIATPIGNLEDITLRALRLLREADVVACEDTRQTRKLLARYGIARPLVSYHEHNEATRAPQLLARLQAGQSVALVSDAGTPLISDPGHRLVCQAVAAGIAVVPIPGPSALLAALAGSGLPAETFHFAGFLPAKRSERLEALGSLREERATVVLYEAPHRILETLEDLEATLGPRRVVVARELTKIHEEFLRGTAAEIRRILASRPAVRGEFTVVIEGARPEKTRAEASADLRAAVEERQRQGLSRMEAIKAVARERGLPKRSVYQLVELDERSEA